MILDVATILDLEQRRIASMLAADEEGLTYLLLPEAIWVHASSREDDKASFLAGFREGRLVAHALTLSDQAVHIYGDVGLCHGTVVMDATMDGKRQTTTNRYSTLWVGVADGFRLAIYQATGTAK